MAHDSDEPRYRVYRAGSDAPGGRGGASGAPGGRGGGAGAPGGRGGASGAPGGGGGGAGGGGGSGAAAGERPDYKVYRSGPRGLRERLRPEDQPAWAPGGAGPVPGGGLRRRRLLGGRLLGGRLLGGRLLGGRLLGGRLTWRRALVYLVLLVVGWLLLSFVLFMISAQVERGKLPSSASDALASGANMVTGTDNVLILGTDQRPKIGAGSKEPGSNYSDVGANSDTIMLWRIGGGVSRRLSIPRDTVADIPGHGLAKINAGYAIGGPALEIKTVERFTGLRINHVVIVNLGAFPPFIDAVGGVDVKTGRVCSDISGGTKNGGFSLYLAPGVHHLDGIQALVYARTRKNKCNPADNDLTRVQHQQQILNAIKSKLLSAGTFFRLPWVSWDAPKVLRSDMGGPALLSLFIASETGGSAPVKVLEPTGAEVLPGYGDALTVTPAAVHAAVDRLVNG